MSGDGVAWDTIPQMVLSAGDRFVDAEAVVDGELRLTWSSATSYS